jgi:uncharacterized protein
MGWLSPYLVTIAIAWVATQGLKYIIDAIITRKLPTARQLYFSGGMPSAHSALTMALLVTVGYYNGLGSPIFAVTLALTAVVMYDAIMVRRSSGEQGASLTALIKEQKSSVRLPRVAKGHTPLEVLVGAFVGALIAVIVILIVK